MHMHFIAAGNIVIYQSRANASRLEGSWRVTGIATVNQNVDFTFYCTKETGNGQSTILQWLAVNDFTTVSQQTVEGGQLLILTHTQRSQIGEYICRDTLRHEDTRLLLIEGTYTDDVMFICPNTSLINVVEYLITPVYCVASLITN